MMESPGLRLCPTTTVPETEEAGVPSTSTVLPQLGSAACDYTATLKGGLSRLEGARREQVSDDCREDQEIKQSEPHRHVAWGAQLCSLPLEEDGDLLWALTACQGSLLSWLILAALGLRRSTGSCTSSQHTRLALLPDPGKGQKPGTLDYFEAIPGSPVPTGRVAGCQRTSPPGEP